MVPKPCRVAWRRDLKRLRYPPALRLTWRLLSLNPRIVPFESVDIKQAIADSLPAIAQLKLSMPLIQTLNEVLQLVNLYFHGTPGRSHHVPLP